MKSLQSGKRLRFFLLAVIAFSIFIAACATPRTRPPAVDSSVSSQERQKQEELAAQEEIRMEARLGSVEIGLKRENKELTPYGVALKKDSSIGAFANGKMVVVTSGMVRFCQTNDELALVVGHEMAHNAMNHMGAKRANAAGGMIVDILLSALGVPTHGAFSDLASNAYSPSFEMEADYVGLYYAARAGFDISNAANFWRRMAISDPRAMNGGLTHPSSADRFVALEAATAEIQVKIVSGAPLVPEVKEAEAAVMRAEAADRDAFGAKK